MLAETPKFLTNPAWYRFDPEKKKIVLTDEAPEDVRKSYEDFYDKNQDE